MLSAGLSTMLAHIISATSKSTVPAIMSFLVGISAVETGFGSTATDSSRDGCFYNLNNHNKIP